MTDVALDEAEAPPKKGGKLGLILGVVLALVLGGGGFFATYSGLVPLPFGGGDPAHEEAEAPKPDLPPVGFVPLDSITVSLGPGANARHLQFTAQLEIDPAQEAQVRLLVPRVLDVINTYLRAVEITDLENPAAMSRLRAQLLRRIQIVTGNGGVRDLLVTEFIIN